ncbi:MAG TPA: type I glyceraldehyde-3-phosphate dehydrogenase [Nitriliruptorales bacterium]|nr:type I glyceraldehyde-3-phosphate dehydrogenase [Nitriliruptorales bacterium]
MAIKVGINGFGRIGRMFFRAAKQRELDLDFVALNDLTDPATLALLLRHDSVYGRYPGEVEVTDDGMRVEGDEMRVLAERDPGSLPWKDLGVDVVVESTGLFRDRESASKHLDAGAKKVVISAPAKGEDVTVVLGANDDDYDPDSHHILSIASCTTNCVVLLAKVLHESFGIERGFMTTVHAYTNDQSLQDQPHSDPRRARAAALSIIPTTTGAAKASSLALPDLKGRMDGMALRVPVPVGSITDLVVVAERETTLDEVNEAFQKSSAGELQGLLGYTEEPLVSSDIVGNPNSCIFDAGSTMTIGNLIKVFGWYDNEWGFSNRLAEMVQRVGEKL